MIYCFLAEGFEETEAIAPIDVLRRAGFEVVTVGIGGEMITGSHGIPVSADITDAEAELTSELQMIVLPGGMPGTLNLEQNTVVLKAIDYCVENNIYIAAICAAPSILGKRGLLKGRNAVCFPGFEDKMDGAVLQKEPVVRDGNFITAKGAGAAVAFGLKLVEVLDCAETAEELAKKMQCS